MADWKVKTILNCSECIYLRFPPSLGFEKYGLLCTSMQTKSKTNESKFTAICTKENCPLKVEE